MTEDDGEWFTDPEHHWQASNLVKCVVSTAAVIYIEHMRSQITKVKVKNDRAFESSFNAPHIYSGSLIPAYYIQYNYPQHNCEREVLNIYFPCVFFPLCELLKRAELWNSQSEQSSTLSRTVKQPIRAELNIIIHDPSK